MRTIFSILILTFTLLSSAQADWQNGGRWGGGWRGPRPGPGPGGPGWGPPPNVTCQALDNGWEEHWGGHGSCGECLSRHGNCTERCSITSYQCRAEGQGFQGRTEFFEAYANDEWQARNEAVNRCYYRGLANCRVTQCNTNQQEVSRRSCR